MTTQDNKYALLKALYPSDFGSIYAAEQRFFEERSSGAFCPGHANTYISCNPIFSAGAGGKNLTNDLEIRVKLALESYRPQQENQMVGRWGNGTANHFSLNLRTGGVLGLNWRDGTTSHFPGSTAALPQWDPWTPVWLRATRTKSTGIVRFYYSLDDAATWTQLGADVVSNAGVGLGANTDAELRIDHQAITQPMIVYRLLIGDMTGAWAVDTDLTALPAGYAAFADSTNAVWSFVKSTNLTGAVRDRFDTYEGQLEYKRSFGVSRAGASAADVDYEFWRTRTRAAHMGVNTTGLILFNGTASMQADLDLIVAAGLEIVRVDFAASAINDTAEGVYSWGIHDTLVDECERRGLRIIGCLTYSPSWNREVGGNTDHYVPADNQKWANFAAAVAGRYAGRAGILAWEVWNEPNGNTFFVTSGNSADIYADLLKKTFIAIKSADPNVTVLTGGTTNVSTNSTTTWDVPDWYAALYARGCQGYFDGVGMHPYQHTNDPNVTPNDLQPWNGLTKALDVYALMCANGDGAKRIWATESGEYTGTAAGAATEAEQARRIQVDSNRWFAWPFTAVWCHHMHRDSGTDATNSEQNYGIYKHDGTAKAAVATVQTLAAAERVRFQQ